MGAEKASATPAGSLPWRFLLAERLCRLAPPILAPTIRTVVYPRDLAYRDDRDHGRRALTGSRFVAPTADFHGYTFAVQGYYEWRSWAIAAAVCRPGDTIVEAGANIGTETVGFRDIVGSSGRVIAFEPLPANHRRLLDLVALNAWRNVEVIDCALGESRGEVAFRLPRDKTVSGVGFVDPSGAGAAEGTIRVRLQTLDDLAETLGSARALFIDCEGAEPRILRGGRAFLERVRPLIVLEASATLLERAGDSLDGLFRLVNGSNYAVFAVQRFGLRSIDSAPAGRDGNWLCLPRGDEQLARAVGRAIRHSALLPPLRPWHPLARIAARRR